MKNFGKRPFIFSCLAIVMLLILLIAPFITSAQVVGLDNWYNRETNAKGQPFHYLWTDTENSGYSQWGELFKKKGATLSTLESAATSKNLAKLDVYIIVDPDTTTESKSPNYILADDIKAIKKWVEKGGVLVLMANDAPIVNLPISISWQLGLASISTTSVCIRCSNVIGIWAHLPRFLIIRSSKVFPRFT